jgi:GDP/UDP-N,N'-diacetylbacillosamine 2-epimerase (hydrolysing)
MKFAQIWSAEKYDLIVCLGDRYEMFAAVSASVPFRIPVAHIHGGETTLGAIDNIYRHTLTHISQLHFVSTEKYKQKVVSLLGDSSHVYNVGAMSIDNLMEIELMSPETFLETFGIDLSKKSILITLHPETVAYEKNEIYVQELVKALKRLAENYQLIITMPNLDTLGSMIREELNTFISASEGKAIGVESFGTLGYLSCMKHCAFLLGNTSSGFVEASFFPKQVINLGERQSGRIRTPNILDCALEEAEIMKAVAEIEKSEKLEKIETYGTGQTAKKIHKILKQFL